MYTLLRLKWMSNKDVLYGTFLNVMWQPRWEGSLGQNEYMYVYGWVPFLLTWNYHNIAKQLYPIAIYTYIYIKKRIGE